MIKSNLFLAQAIFLESTHFFCFFVDLKGHSKCKMKPHFEFAFLCQLVGQFFSHLHKDRGPYPKVSEINRVSTCRGSRSGQNLRSRFDSNKFHVATFGYWFLIEPGKKI